MMTGNRIGTWALAGALLFTVAGPVGPGRAHAATQPAGVPLEVTVAPGKTDQDDVLDEPDALEVCRRMIELSEEQREQLTELAEGRELARRDAVARVDLQYAEKAKAMLTAGQKERFEFAAETLKAFGAEVRAAVKELTAAVGEPIARQVTTGNVASTTDMVGFLNLTPQQREKIAEAQKEALAAMAKARDAVRPPADPSDAAARAAYEQAMMAAYQKAKAQFDEKLAAMLSEKQAQELAALKEALEAYRERIAAAEAVVNEKLGLRKSVDVQLRPPAEGERQ